FEEAGAVQLIEAAAGHGAVDVGAGDSTEDGLGSARRPLPALVGDRLHKREFRLLRADGVPGGGLRVGQVGALAVGGDGEELAAAGEVSEVAACRVAADAGPGSEGVEVLGSSGRDGLPGPAFDEGEQAVAACGDVQEAPGGDGGGHCWSLSAQVTQRPSRVKGPVV